MIQYVYFPNHFFFLGGSGSGISSALKNLSEESSSRTYQKYCPIGIMNDPTTRIARIAVYFPVINIDKDNNEFRRNNLKEICIPHYTTSG